MQKFYKPEEVAGLLSLDSELVISLIQSGQLRGYLIGNQTRIGEEDLKQFLEKCVVPTVFSSVSSAMRNGGMVTVRPSDADQRKECPTFGGQATFSYCGSAATGTIIWPGKKVSYKLRFDADQWAALLVEFRGKEVRAGLNFSHPESGSFGEWIKIRWNTKMGPAAYVGGILIQEGYAERPRPGWIRFFDARKD